MPPRPAKRSATAVERQIADRGIERVDHYGDWKKGDVCGIVGAAGMFIFMSARIVDGEVVSVDVYGGKGKKERMRAFTPDRLTTEFAKKSKKKDIYAHR